MKIKKILTIVITVITLSVGIVLGIWQIKPPRADDSSFAYQRMMDHIQSLAAEAHPSGSDEIERVRTELLAEIEEMGLSPAVEDASYTLYGNDEAAVWIYDQKSRQEWWEENELIAEEYYGVESAEEWFSTMVLDKTLPLKNIFVKLDAPESENGVMFVSHYDSTYGGPGVADDMVAVCAMLEAMREQSQKDELQNDLYFLFTDGEEEGMRGAFQFVSSHPELKDTINMVVNLEARGNRGALLLFETSPKAYYLVEAVLKSGARPVAASWMAMFYAMMPVSTDLSEFLDAGYRGINFAVVEGVENYHQPTDSYENLDRNSAWQYLRTTLALADYAANNSLDDLRVPKEAVYFPFFPGNLVLISGFGSQLLGFFICILAMIYAVGKIKKREFKGSFYHILIGLLVVFTVGSMVFFPFGSYLFYLPLLIMVMAALLNRWQVAHALASIFGCIIVLLLWVPVLFLLWVAMVQPMML